MRFAPWTLLERTFGWGGVIAYHGVGTSPHSTAMHVSPDRLRAHLAFLRERYTVVPLRELIDRWHRGSSTRGCVAITFDDAYVGVARFAQPILRELDLEATIFVTTSHAAAGAAYWWDAAELDRLSCRGAPWENTPGMLGLRSLESGQALSMDTVRSRVLAGYNGRWPGALRGDESVWRSMTWDELRALAADERFDFGVHTESHPALPFLSEREQVSEMAENLATLRHRLPRVLPVVAYPYGLYDRTTVRAARQAGLVAGLTMEGRAPSAHPNPMIIPRVGGGEAYLPQSMARRLTRALRPALILRNGSIHPRLPTDPMSARMAASRAPAAAVETPQNLRLTMAAAAVHASDSDDARSPSRKTP
jgi:peptidoglycan/xylan/chitin deacetylase (PgdA/CDA1 family)